MRARPGPAPLLAVVPGAGGKIQAAAVAACQRENGTLLIGENSHPGRGERPSRPAETWLAVIGPTWRARQDAIRVLGKTIAGLEQPWRLDISGLNWQTARLLASVVPGAKTSPADAVPILDLDVWAPSKNARSRRSRSERRIAEDRITEEIRFTDDPMDLLLLRDVIEAAHRDRDLTARRPCDLETYPHALAFWHLAWNAAAATGDLEVAVLLLDGELAAYCAAYKRPPVLQVFDSRMITAKGSYRPGFRTEVTVAELAALHPAYHILDWTLPSEEGLLGFTRKEPRWAVTAAML